MAPPIIDDREALLEIAVIYQSKPNLKFAAVCRMALQRVEVHSHSEESARRRLQRKFNKQPTYWLAQGQEELVERRRLAFRQAGQTIARVAQIANLALNQAVYAAAEVSCRLERQMSTINMMTDYYRHSPALKIATEISAQAMEASREFSIGMTEAQNSNSDQMS